MGSFKIIEDRPTPKEVYNWRIYLFSAVASAGAMVFGYDGAFFGTTLARVSFQEHFGLKTMSKAEQTNTSANLTSSYLAAAFFGALFCWPTMETMGRKIAIQVSAAIFFVGAIIMVAATHQLSYIYAGRALTGFAAGALTAVIPTFVAETAPPPIRGFLVGFFEISYQAGSLVGFWINYGINQHIPLDSVKSFRIPMAIQLVPGGLLAIGSIFLRESPSFLYRKGKQEKALKNLEFLRMVPADHHYIQEEIAFIRARMEDELELSGGKSGVMGYLKGAFKELKIKHIRHRVIIVFFMFAFQNFSGAAVINYYSPTLFKGLGISDTALYTGVYGLVKAVGSFVFFAAIVDRSGRRIPWLISASVCSGCLLYLAVFSKLANQKPPLSHSTKQGGKGAICFVMFYSLFWSFGGNGLPWIVSSELFPLRLRSLTGAYGAMVQWLVSYCATEAFPHMYTSKMGLWGTFLFYSLACAATFVFTFIWVPETKAIPIECMETLFSGPVRHAAWRQKRVYPPNGIPPVPESLMARDGDLKHETENVEREQSRV